MTNNRSIFALILCLLSLGSLSAASTPPPAPPPTTVTISDSFAPHGAYVRWEQFSTDLAASVANPPQSTTETTITGPTYSWAVTSQSPSSPTFTIIDSGNGNATLQSPTPSESVCFVAGGGTYNVYVNCTVTYTSTDNKTGVATPLSFSATSPLDVMFFVRVPVKVVSGGSKTHTSQGGGHADAYPLEIIDNQSTPQTYGNGLAHETFANAKDGSGNAIPDSEFSPGGPFTWNMDVGETGYATGTGEPVTNTFTDYWQVPNPKNLPSNSLADTFNQPWFCAELTPPYNAEEANMYFAYGVYRIDHNNPTNSSFFPNVCLTPLNTHTGSETYGNSLRSYPGQAPY